MKNPIVKGSVGSGPGFGGRIQKQYWGSGGRGFGGSEEVRRDYMRWVRKWRGDERRFGREVSGRGSSGVRRKDLGNDCRDGVRGRIPLEERT